MYRQEEIEKQSLSYQDSNFGYHVVEDYQKVDYSNKMNIVDIDKAFKIGAQWADKTMIDKACAWLEENFSRNEELSKAFVSDFRKAMEE